MPTFKQLKQSHPDYDYNAIISNDLLYVGGSQFRKNAEMFLPRSEDEGDEFYQERLNTAYDPIYANVLDRYKALLFANSLSVVPSASKSSQDDKSKPVNKGLMDFIHQFEKNCDGNGTSLHNFARESFICALKHDRSVCMVDFPRVEQDKQATNLADQRASGQLNGYLVNIPLVNLINWQKDEHGNYEWLALSYKIEHQDNPLSPHMCLYKFIHVFMEAGKVVFKEYEKDINLDNDEVINEDDDIQLVNTVITSYTSLNVAELCLNPGLQLGNLIAPMAEQLFRTDALINASTQRNVIMTLAIYKAGNNLPPAPQGSLRAVNTVQMNTSRFQSPQMIQKTSGWHTIGKDDDVKILETEGKAIACLQEQKKIIIERINASVHQVAQNIQSRGSAQAQSAAAKEEDRRDTEIMLQEYKLCVEAFILRIISILLQLRQEQMELHVEGLNVEDDIDRKEVLAEVVAYGQFPDADIFKINYEYNNALALLTDDLSEDDKHDLREQIEESVKNRPSNAEMQQMKDSPQIVGKSKSTNDDNSEKETVLGPAGQPLMPEGAHHATGEHIDSSVVYDQLTKDYKEKDIEFVKHMAWLDQTEVPLSSIDFSNKDNWQASQEPEQVEKFADKMQDGFDKPIILVNNLSNNGKMMVVDGHHRALAALKLGLPVNAYVGQVTNNHGPWEKLHSKQVGSKQASDQIAEASMQKEISNQVKKSEEDNR